MKKSEATRERILDRALQLLRRRGFDQTTMREIADAAGLALGAAYYYFPSKEAILLAYYDRNEIDHEARAAAALAKASGLRERLGLLMHQKLESVKRERKLLGAIVQRLANPADPISAFAEETRGVRQRSMALFSRALENEPLSDELKRLVGPALWMLHMGFLLYFVHDRSPGQKKTHQLVDDTLDLVVPLIYLGASPQTAPLVAQLARTLERAGLIRRAR
jgi:AcrR family transcriptional regulator